MGLNIVVCDTIVEAAEVYYKSSLIEFGQIQSKMKYSTFTTKNGRIFFISL